MHQQLKIVLATLAITMLHTVSAQRPSFAGSRPVGGLNQKDKYHNTVDNGVDIANRFGGASASTPATNTIAFGAAQRPPVGLPVVMPQSVYVPLESSSVRAGETPQFVVNNRIGGSDTATASASAGAGASTGAVFPTAAAPNTIQGFPIDAHGDQLLIDQLNLVPEDRRPFWFLNYQAIEAQRNGSGPNFSGAIASRGSFFG